MHWNYLYCLMSSSQPFASFVHYFPLVLPTPPSSVSDFLPHYHSSNSLPFSLSLAVFFPLGTLTQNKMTAIRAFCPGMEDEVLLISEGGHLDDKGYTVMLLLVFFLFFSPLISLFLVFISHALTIFLSTSILSVYVHVSLYTSIYQSIASISLLVLPFKLSFTCTLPLPPPQPYPCS